MSTDTILEILRHHDNPCAVLERHAPLFALFELEPVMHYARAHFSSTPRLYLSVLLAALNGACRKPCWKINLRGGINPFPRESKTWGEAPIHHMCLAMGTMQGGQCQHIHAHYIDKFPGMLNSIVLALPFTRYYTYTVPDTYHGIYALSLAEALAPHGAKVLSEIYASRFEEEYVHEHVLLDVPLSKLPQCAHALLDAIRGPDVITTIPGDPPLLTPGPLAIKVATRLGITREDLEDWARDEVEHIDPDDIPF